ncbi:MAG TPA: PaaX family transcriptional regulator C-terminal domain-containing protein [Blastocatellia bacterium]|nr:PaaX family transcriptional regulator C-terminal domain-containing protein [Blastocatellia bacterium]
MKRDYVQTQSLMFTLYGDYIYPREGWAWTASLIRMLEVLGVSDQATRSALSRMSGHGWLKPSKRGRLSLYTLTAKGRRLMEEGTRRIYSEPSSSWDGQWRVVVYSLPEERRHLREALRRRLEWLGFGRLGPGTWISPHDQQADLEQILDDVGVRRFVDRFIGAWVGTSNQDLVSRCWDLKDLGRRYSAFINNWRPKFERHLRSESDGETTNAADCFVNRFWIIHDYRAFAQADPGLPCELLPVDWRGDEARQLFLQYHDALTAPASNFIDTALNQGIDLDEHPIQSAETVAAGSRASVSA